MGRISAMLFSLASYILGMAAIIGLILWMANWYLPVTVDKGFSPAQLDLSPVLAVFWNAVLVLIALWAAPTMTLGRLVLAIGWTVYIYFGLRNEEKTLLADLGNQYRDYQKTTPMVIPFVKP